MRMRWIAIALMALLGGQAMADDEMKLKNGDRLTGKLLDLGKGKVRFQTAHSGVLTVDWGQVADIRTDGKVAVKLQSGELLEGKLSTKEGKLWVESEGVGGGVAIGFDRVRWFNEPPTQWHGSVSLAVRASDGNTHTQGILLTAEGTRATEVDQFTLRAIFRYGKQKGELSERNGYGLGQYQYVLADGLYAYGSVELYSDTFKDLALRTIVSAGGGFVILKEERIDASIQAGISYVDNDFRVAEDESHVGARIAAHLRLALPLGFQIVDDVVWYPNFETTPDWQLHNEAAVSTSLGEGWTLKAGVITDYDNRVEEGVKKMDDVYFVGLGFQF